MTPQPRGNSDPASALEPLTITAWLAGPPDLSDEAQLVMSLVEDILVVRRGPADQVKIETLLSDEPRTYSADRRGLGALAEKIRVKAVGGLDISGSAPGGSIGDVTAQINLGRSHPYRSPLATSVWIAMRSNGDRADTAARLVDFVKGWFVPMRAASAFVSYSGRPGAGHSSDWGTVTRHEAAPDRTVLVEWADLRRFARGAFWGTGLGFELCERLGGRDRILSQAPAPVKEHLNGAVWLQLSSVPPADELALQKLSSFMSPLLQWTRADLRTQFPESRPTMPESGGRRRRPEDLPTAHRVPMRILDSFHEDRSGGLNIYLAVAPNPEQRIAIEESVRTWYESSFQGFFASRFGIGFHDIQGPRIDGRIMRWVIDLGIANSREALDALAVRLALLPGVEIDQLVVGTERVE